MSTNTLSERAMLVSLNIRRWAAARTDKKITAEVASSHAVSEKRAGRYRKNAIDVEATSFKGVVMAATDLRTKHYFYTLPWAQDGARILTTAMFEQYSTEMRLLRADFEDAVSTFVKDYARLKAAAKLELNGMYNEQDYPINIGAKFGVDIVFMPLPDCEDFRATLSQDTVAEIRKDIRTELQNATHLAMREPYERLYTHISRMVERLSHKKAVFRDTLVTGLADLCAVLPGLNLTGDTRLEDLRKRAENMIANIDPQDLREVPSIRNDVAKQAAEIQHLMAGFMGTVPGEAA
jgi:hypothetical protein